MAEARDLSPGEREALAKEFRELEEIRNRDAKSRAVVLEILGDIPDADIAPPKNVLFVCKLNPVTEEGDLKIIFSRFGTVNKCDIIKDYVTGDSLQYAFIEFETEESCNEAYFKMQNVLIDDRRIHVDFCQSVSGFWKRYHANETFTRQKRREYRPHDSRRWKDAHHGDHRHHYKHRKRSRSRDHHRHRSRDNDRHSTRHHSRHHSRDRSRDHDRHHGRYRERDRHGSRERHGR